MQQLKVKVEELQQERDETIGKFTENENIWAGKLKQVNEDKEQLIQMNTGLKDANKDLFIEIDKYVKRNKQLENQVEREKELVREHDLEIRDLKKDNKKQEEFINEKMKESEQLNRKMAEVQM